MLTWLSIPLHNVILKLWRHSGAAIAHSCPSYGCHVCRPHSQTFSFTISIQVSIANQLTGLLGHFAASISKNAQSTLRPDTTTPTLLCIPTTISASCRRVNKLDNPAAVSSVDTVAPKRAIVSAKRKVGQVIVASHPPAGKKNLAEKPTETNPDSCPRRREPCASCHFGLTSQPQPQSNAGPGKHFSCITDVFCAKRSRQTVASQPAPRRLGLLANGLFQGSRRAPGTLHGLNNWRPQAQRCDHEP